MHPCITKRSSWKNRASHSLILKADSTFLAERTPSRAVCKIRSYCVLDGDFQLFLECLDLAGKMRFRLLHRKGLETPANTHHFNSVSWMHTLKTVLLGSSVLVLEEDISQYRVCSLSPGYIKTQLLEETCFWLSDSEGGFNSLSWANTQESSLQDTFFLCFRRRFSAIPWMPGFGWENAFCASSQKGFRNSCKHTSV